MGSRRSFELSHVPNIGFKYGNEEYLAITGRSLVKGDLVAWSLPNGTNLLVENEEPLVGIVEFVGCKGTPTTENLPPELKAVVQFVRLFLNTLNNKLKNNFNLFGFILLRRHNQHVIYLATSQPHLVTGILFLPVN